MDTFILPDLSEIKIQNKLSELKSTLPEKVCRSTVVCHNPIAGKWDAPYRSLVIRETTMYRSYDLLQSSMLENLSMIGKKLTIRASLETIAILFYLNTITKKTVEGSQSFFDFAQSTGKLLLGNKSVDSLLEPINVVNLINEMSLKIPVIKEMYAELSEFAHPNYSGFLDFYTRADLTKYETTFGFFSSDQQHKLNLYLIDTFIDLLLYQYNIVWIENFNELLEWIEKNDKKLCKQKKMMNKPNTKNEI